MTKSIVTLLTAKAVSLNQMSGQFSRWLIGGNSMASNAQAPLEFGFRPG